MKRILAHLLSAGRNERGAVIPILLMSSSIMVITGVAFLSVTSRDAETTLIGKAHIVAQYAAEEAAYIALWRMEILSESSWDTAVSSINDSLRSASYDTTTGILTAVGYYGSIVADTVEVTMSSDTTTALEQLGHIILYKKHLDLHDGANLIHGPDNGPLKMSKGKHSKKKIKMRHSMFKSKFWTKGNKGKKGKGKGPDLVIKYKGNQTFDGPMADGIHWVNGDVELHDGVTLNGTIAAKGKISFSGNVTITAMQVPDHHSAYPAYFPAVAAMRGSNAEQDLEDDTEDVFFDLGEITPNVNITGLVFSRRRIHFHNTTVNGLIIAKDVDLGENTTVTYNSLYAFPPLPQLQVPAVVKPRVIKWKEKWSGGQ